MDEYTRCNYCLLKAIRASYKGKGRIYLRPGKVDGYIKVLGMGVNVIFVPKGKTLSQGKKLDWFMELSEKCVC